MAHSLSLTSLFDESSRAPLLRVGRGRLLWSRFLCTALLVVTAPVFAGNTAASDNGGVIEWLTRMHEASRQRAYVGTLVVSAGSSMSSSRIWHVCDGKQQMERVDTLTGEPRTTVRHNNQVITFAPESKVAWVEKRESLGLFPELLRTPRSQIAAYYSARERTPDRVAGHLAAVVDIEPKDGLRFGYRIWSEQKTGLVVKMQTLNERGDVLEQVAFTELQLNAPVRMDKLKQVMSDTRGYEVHRPVLHKSTPEAEGWRLREDVPGFASMSCHTRESEDGAVAPVQWVFSDGLASVSLFIESFDPQRHGKELRAVMGATHSLTRRVGDYWLTAMGEVPPATLQRFADALERLR